MKNKKITVKSILLHFAWNNLGAAALTTKNVKPKILPNVESMNFVLRVKDQNILVPLNQPEKLWLSPQFNSSLPLIFMITGWTTNYNKSENPTLETIYAAYRCRGNYNFVVINKDF